MTATRSYRQTIGRENATILQGDIHGSLVINNHPAKKQDKFDILLKSLSFDRMNSRVRNVAKALPQTCTWILNHHQFRLWIDETQMKTHHGFLWIKGKPGSGKSTIMKETLMWAEKHWSSKIILSYFFNARSHYELEKSSLGLYRSLLHQVLSAHCDSNPLFVEAFASKVRDEKVVEEWMAVEMRNFLVTLVTTLSLPPLVIFIDALDEGDDDDIQQMVSFLELLAKHANASASQLRICLSSRHYPHIEVDHSLSLIVEEQAGHNDDIEKYVHNTLKGVNSPQKQGLQQSILKRSSGIFLWVVLVIAVLNKAYNRGQNFAVMLKKLEEIPLDLHDVFGQILSRDLEDIEECHALLKWVLFSMTPLTPAQLYSAVQFSCSAECTDEVVTLSEDTLERYLLHCSRGLVEFALENSISLPQPSYKTTFADVEKPDYKSRKDDLSKDDFLDEPEDESGYDYNDPHDSPHGGYYDDSRKKSDRSRRRDLRDTPLPTSIKFLAQVIHETVRHYLIVTDVLRQQISTAPTILLSPSISTSDICHAYIAEYCVRYLLRVREKAPPNIEALPKFPLADYAAEHWWQHAQSTKIPCSSQFLEAARELLMCRRSHFFSWVFRAAKPLFRRGALVLPWSLASPLYYATATRLPELISHMLVRGASMAPCGNSFGSVLSFPSMHGDEDIVRMLIENGVSINEQGFGKSPLTIASMHGQTKIVQMLLEHGAAVNFRANEPSPLILASKFGYVEIVRLLLLHGANVNELNSDGQSALCEAVCYCKERVVGLLLEHGANPNSRVEILNMTMLETAVQLGAEKIVQALLQHGAEVNASIVRPLSFFIAKPVLVLHEAVSQGYTSIVQLLVDHSVDTNTRDEYGDTALHVAVDQDEGEIIQILLRHGANSDALSEGGTTALQHAAACGHEQSVRVLLQFGISVDLEDSRQRTALHNAAVKGNEKIVEMLLKYGANVNAVSCAGTPLDLALELRRKAAARVLRGADGKTSAEMKLSESAPPSND